MQRCRRRFHGSHCRVLRAGARDVCAIARAAASSCEPARRQRRSRRDSSARFHLRDSSVRCDGGDEEGARTGLLARSGKRGESQRSRQAGVKARTSKACSHIHKRERTTRSLRRLDGCLLALRARYEP